LKRDLHITKRTRAHTHTHR